MDLSSFDPISLTSDTTSDQSILRDRSAHKVIFSEIVAMVPISLYRFVPQLSFDWNMVLIQYNMTILNMS